MTLSVSRETTDKFKHYAELLLKWQKAINLVSPSTLNQIEKRHILDSAQIDALLPSEPLTIFDLGSGGGFPGMVLAMMRPDANVYLIESDARKCSFLQAVSRETKTPVHVVNQRIESVDLTVKPDIITARALASLKELLDLSIGFAQANPALILIFSKGARAEEEIEEAKAFYDFAADLTPSLTDPSARIVRLTGLHIK